MQAGWITGSRRTLAKVQARSLLHYVRSEGSRTELHVLHIERVTQVRYTNT
jgi:hypothetical protein